MNFKAVHEKVKRFYCNWCSFGCYYQVNLEKHERLKHSEENTDAENSDNNNSSDSDSKTDKEHESERNRCKICDKTFKSSNYVQEHIESVHEKSKDFSVIYVTIEHTMTIILGDITNEYMIKN